NAGGADEISVSDVDVNETPAPNNTLQVTLSVDHGTLTLGSTTGLTFTTGDGTADASMTFRGTQSAINAALDGLTYAPAANYNGPASLTIATTDLGHATAAALFTDPDSVSITVNPVNDKPTADNKTVTTNEDTLKTVTLSGS